MQVDLTDAAKFYGLQTVPPIVFDYDKTQSAAFVDVDRAIHINPDFLRQDLTDDYSEARFTNAGAPHLDSADAHRFVIAHELYHAVQLQNLGMDAMRADQLQINQQVMQVTHGLPLQIASDLGIASFEDIEAAHDQDPFEADADKHAATAYQLIKFDATS